MSTSAFARFWQTDLTREAFLENVTRDELCTMRLVSRDFAYSIAPRLFKSITVNFSINTFSRRCRMLALDRIGHDIKSFRFVLPHSKETFLPPLIDPETLEDVSFLYEPQHYASRPSSSTSDSLMSKYGSWEMNDLLVRQYPPLFHAATNTMSFVRAFNAMPFLRHITISCPDQPAGHQFRRSAVDYALISLRLAIEATNPPFLDTFSLDSMYPSGVFYLRPNTGIGTSPASTRVWHRIKTLNITMENLPTSTFEEDHNAEHLKILHTYLRAFRALKSFNFAWLGTSGPCPVALDAEPCTSRPSSLECGNSCPTMAALPACRPIKFRKLRTMQLDNVVLDASQASQFITTHRKTLRDIDFQACTLRSGTWDDALEPLSRMSGSDSWRGNTTSGTTSASSASSFEVMDVPIMYSPVEEVSNPMECVRELLWDETDHDVMRAVNRVAKDVFKHYGAGLNGKKRRRNMLACGLRNLFRSMGPRWH